MNNDMMQTVVTDKSSGNYKKSMDIVDHTKEKSNKCSQCDYASSYASALKTHMKTHTGEKSNKCNQCDYASSQAGNLRTQMKKHTGEKSNSPAGNLKAQI